MIEKIPAESGPCAMGVCVTSQVRPRSAEWKTRAAEPPVANQMLARAATILTRIAEEEVLGFLKGSCRAAVPFSRVPSGGRRAIHELLAANAPSPVIAAGRSSGGIGRHVWPSSLISNSNFNVPVSSAIGSPRMIPCVESQNAIESKNPLGLLLVNCRDQCWPASVV